MKFRLCLSIFIFPILINTIQAQYSVGCSTSTFWAVKGTGEIDRFTLSGGIATLDSTVISNGFSNSIAICNNLDTNIGGPTFYNTNSTQLKYYDGTGWTLSPVSFSYNIYNGGGCMNYLYFTANMGAGLNTIVRYDGNVLTTVYTLDAGRKITVADIAADQSGNIWLFAGATASPVSDTLEVITPLGTVLYKYPLQLNSAGAYGCFMQDDVIYVGLGTANPVNPSSLVPISVGTGQPIIGTAIAMPANNYADLANCNSAEQPTAINNIDLQNDFNIFPNPVSEKLSISSSFIQAGDKIKIYGMNGALVMMQEATGSIDFTFDVSELRKGMYVLCVEKESGVYRKVFVRGE